MVQLSQRRVQQIIRQAKHTDGTHARG
jgi:hypothetical protein